MINFENFGEMEFEAVALEVQRHGKNGAFFYSTRLAFVIDVEDNIALFVSLGAGGTTAMEAAKAAMMPVLRLFERIATHAPVLDASIAELIEFLDLEDHIQEWMQEATDEHEVPPGVTIH